MRNWHIQTYLYICYCFFALDLQRRVESRTSTRKTTKVLRLCGLVGVLCVLSSQALYARSRRKRGRWLLLFLITPRKAIHGPHSLPFPFDSSLLLSFALYPKLLKPRLSPFLLFVSVVSFLSISRSLSC